MIPEQPGMPPWFMCASLPVTLVGRSATPEALLNLYSHPDPAEYLQVLSYWQQEAYLLVIYVCSPWCLDKRLPRHLLPVAVSFLFFGIKDGKSSWLFFNPVGLMVFGLIVIPWYPGNSCSMARRFSVICSCCRGGKSMNMTLSAFPCPITRIRFLYSSGCCRSAPVHQSHFPHRETAV